MENKDFSGKYKVIYIEFIDDISLKKIESYLNQYPNEKILLNIPNTKNITIESLNLLPKSGRIFVRIEGGFDKKRLASYQERPYLFIHAFSNIYTISELKGIIKEIEKIEKGMFSTWSEEQKLLYFISTLQNTIIYHPDFISMPTHEIRSLRGLLSRKTVCAGYSLILKELCDRNNIECDYVEGACNKNDSESGKLTHAWNIVKIRENYYPVDLTWNADDFRYGEMKTVDSLCNSQEFIQTHFPGKYENVKDYINTLKSMDSDFIRKTIQSFNNSKDLYATKFIGIRKDNSKFTITQVGNGIVNGEMVYKYIYIDERNLPIILYSGFNVAGFVLDMEAKDRATKLLKEAERVKDINETKKQEQKLLSLSYINEKLKFFIKDVLFSKDNIKRSIERGNFFVGNIYDYKTNPRVLINLKTASNLKAKIKTYKRNDGTTFILEENNKVCTNGHDLYFYQMFEYIFENNEIHLKCNNIYTGFNLFIDERKEIPDIFLSRNRVDTLAHTNGGYLGSFTKNGQIIEDEGLVPIFDRKKKKELKREQIKIQNMTFDDLRNLLNFYILKIEDNDIVIFNRKTGEILLNKETIQKVIFANMWLEAVKKVNSDAVLDNKYYKIYLSFIKLVSKSISAYNEIKTLEIYEQLVLKYGEEVKDIIAYLFQNNFCLNIIYNLFGTKVSSDPVLIPLYNKKTADRMLADKYSLTDEYDEVTVKK